MGQSLVRNIVHITFSTKHRQPFIHERIEQRLYAYLAKICNNLECPAIEVSGYFDHVHILCKLSKKISLMKLLQVVKANSSGWMKEADSSLKDFYWQDGYGAFSVNPTEIDKVAKYIANQKFHHSKISYEEELKRLLRENGIEYDNRYLWD